MRKFAAIVFIVSGLILSIGIGCQEKMDKTMPSKEETKQEIKWKIHDPDRPQPPTVTPGLPGDQSPAPSDAIILFGGTDLSQWEDSKGQPARWKVENGYMEVVKKTASILTKQKFGSCQLHLEWSAPLPTEGEGQDRGNSGVFLMKLYEVQVLDCYDNTTYVDGMTAAVYGQYPPLVNACRPPGEWQTYDIVFRRPYFDEAGNLAKAGRMTVFHNGILVQDNVELLGPTETYKLGLPYLPHEDSLPLMLQDHGNPVRYRNIWIRELEE